jgi:hypothetical protein
MPVPDTEDVTCSLWGAVVVVTFGVVVVGATVDDGVEAGAATAAFGGVDAGDSPDERMKVIEPTITATEPSTAHDHHTRYSGCRPRRTSGGGGHCCATGCGPCSTGCWSCATGCWTCATGCWSCATGCWSCATGG